MGRQSTQFFLTTLLHNYFFICILFALLKYYAMHAVAKAKSSDWLLSNKFRTPSLGTRVIREPQISLIHFLH